MSSFVVCVNKNTKKNDYFLVVFSPKKPDSFELSIFSVQEH